jgi:hypothetical protein
MALGEQFLTAGPENGAAKNSSCGLLDVDGLRLHNDLQSSLPSSVKYAFKLYTAQVRNPGKTLTQSSFL